MGHSYTYTGRTSANQNHTLEHGDTDYPTGTIGTQGWYIRHLVGGMVVLSEAEAQLTPVP